MHPALSSWREAFPATVVRVLAYVGGAAALSMAAAHLVQSPPSMAPIAAVHTAGWIDVDRPFPAFALAIPEAGDTPAQYQIRRHEAGGGRKDILTLGTPSGSAPLLRVEIYRAGREVTAFADALTTVAGNAAGMEPVDFRREDEPLPSKFGPFGIVSFDALGGNRHCLGFAREHDDPMLQISGYFCASNGVIERPMLACALDRLTLLSAGSEPKIGTLFAQAELNRSYCGQRDTILAPTPKYQTLWKALATRPEPRRVGR